VRAEVFGSLALTGRGHGTDKAVLMGLEGHWPNRIDPDVIPAALERIRGSKSIRLHGQREIAFDEKSDLVMNKRQKLPFHTNGMRFIAYDANGAEVASRDYYSVGGGFVVNQDEAAEDRIVADTTPVAHPFASGDELLARCAASGLSIAQLMLENERAWRSDDEVIAGLRELWTAMQDCVAAVSARPAPCPAACMSRGARRRCTRNCPASRRPRCATPLTVLDWVNLYALAVNEENAAGGRVVTAPTNGAAGIIPAVLHYYDRFCAGAARRACSTFLLTAGRHRHPLQGERVHQRRRGRLPGRGRRGLLDGRRRPDRRAGRHQRADRERRRDRHGAQPRPHLRPDRRAGADPLHRAQRHGRGEGHQRLAHGPARRRQSTRSSRARQGHQDHARHRPRHAGQVQGNQALAAGWRSNVIECKLTLIVFDHVKHRMILVVNARLDKGRDLRDVYQDALVRLEVMRSRIRRPLPAPPSSDHFQTEAGSKAAFEANARRIMERNLRSGIENRDSVDGFRMLSSLTVKSNFEKEEFLGAVRKAKEYIAAGDIFQVVLSQRFSTEIGCAPFDVYRALRAVNPSPYMFYLKCGPEFQLAGSSPEILSKLQDGKVTVRPIAGTRRRGIDAAEDVALEKDLLADEKERAEHVMLVDLGRNDVGRVSRYGSVKVNDFMVIERYSHVMHIVSNVEGEIAKDRDALDVLAATFPAGTLSGAPKIRAMEIIDELEKNRRGPYGGSVVYMAFDGAMDSCITIRTAVIKGNKVFVQAGAGIVADSDPEREYHECVNKAKGMLTAVQMADEGLD
jgi:anthranilate/para-aminobenzoate synthase component I/L-serine deaminase